MSTTSVLQALTSTRIFWFLFILSVAIFIPLGLFLPETCREVVGDGSIPPPWICANISDHVRHRNRKRKGILVDEEKRRKLQDNYRFVVPNPLGTFAVFKDFESNLLMLALSLGKPTPFQFISCLFFV